MGSAQVALRGVGWRRRSLTKYQDDILAGKLFLHPGGL